MKTAVVPILLALGVAASVPAAAAESGAASLGCTGCVAVDLRGIEKKDIWRGMAMIRRGGGQIPGGAMAPGGRGLEKKDIWRGMVLIRPGGSEIPGGAVAPIARGIEKKDI